MPNDSVCELIDNSFFLIDRNYQLAYHQIESLNFVGSFLEKNPISGEQIVELIARRYRRTLMKLLSKCFEGRCFSIEKRLPVANANDHILLITFTPIENKGEIGHVACSVFSDSVNARQLKLINEYSHLTSHQLRAPITNILGLSNANNHVSLDSYDVPKINQLLSDINAQAAKLDNIIRMLNSLLHEGEQMDFGPGMESMKGKHIVLVDDDVITNKIHQMLISKLQMDKQVVLFDKPEQALQYVMEYTPDLILLDLHMPEIDGWKFLQLLEENQVDTDVIIVSSSIDPVERTRAQQFICVKDFLTKPLTYDKVKLIFEN